MIAEKKVTNKKIRFLMVNGTWSEAPQAIPESLPWMLKKPWLTLCELEKAIDGFENLITDFDKYAK